MFVLSIAFGGFRKVREVSWKHFLLFSWISDVVVLSYDQKVFNRRVMPLKKKLIFYVLRFKGSRGLQF